ncbi:MAG: leucine-rich repeat domain-containing protein [Bacteroidia bacterium]
MKKILFIFIICFTQAIAQTEIKTPFDKYGPYGAQVYTDFKTAIKDEGAVYKLNLSYQAMDLKLWPKISKLKNLQALQLQSISVNQWPDDFSALTNLVYLGSYNNEFTKMPKDFKNFGSLMYLEFYNSKIDSIPQEIGYLQHLKTFKFSGNSDTLKLPTTLKYLKAINDIIFESVILDSLPQPLFTIPSVKTLVLANCNIYALPDTLDKTPNLEVLVLDFNKLSAIPRSIYKCKKLFVLSLRKNNITKIPDTICQLKNLTKLDLRDNPISKDAIEELKILLPGCQIFY